MSRTLTDEETLQQRTKKETNETRKKRLQSQELQTDLSIRTDRNKGLTIPCTEEQYEEIIKVLWNGSCSGLVRRNRVCAIILQTEANTGLRIGDVMRLRLCDIIYDNGRYRFHLTEHKTKKKRIFTVPTPVYNMLYRYAKANNIGNDELLFKMTIRNVQKKLDQVTDYLGYRYISSHSFRKRFAIRAYESSNFDVNLVRTLLNHSDTATTIKYLGVSDDRIEKILKKVVNIVESHWDGEGIDDITYDPMLHAESNRPDTLGFRCNVTKSLVEKLEEYCSNEDITLSGAMEEAITDLLEKHTAV